MKTRVLATICLAIFALSGCSPQEVGAYAQLFNKSLEGKASQNETASCVATATNAGAESGRASRYCKCLSEQFAKLTVDERVRLAPGSEAANAATRYCLAQPF
jgi:hypothetical protein